MRIAVATWSNRQVGGVESYLADTLAALAALGHSVVLVCETTAPANRPEIPLPTAIPVWPRDQSNGVLARLRDWRPDVLFCHGLSDAHFERELTGIAPSVLYAHNYAGCCISGAKTFALPVARPCARRFGAACLVRFYPRRCGGLNPLTMMQLYRRGMRAQQNFRLYQQIVTASEHLRRALIDQGLPPHAIRALRPPVQAPDVDESPCAAAPPGPGAPWRLLFLGRMTELKGGAMLLRALPEVATRLSRPLHMTFAGEGPARTTWERVAAQIRAANPSITIDFIGWLDPRQRAAAFAQTHLLVVPSLWPEPFGRVGVEAGWRHIPAAAFASGGIPEWLHDGAGGHLAPSDPPTAHGLAGAIRRCLSDPAQWARLAAGARREAEHYSAHAHAQRLVCLFEESLSDA